MNNASLELGGTNWAEKDASLLGYTVSDDSGRFFPQEFTFARGSNLAATRIGKTGLIEKGRENLLVQSNNFDTTWSTANASVTSGQSGYDGTNDAWLLEATSSSSRIVQNNTTSGAQTFSCYAKAGTANYLAFYNIVSGLSVRAWFNLSNGTIENSLHNIDAKIESLSNGWYRCSITYNETLSNARIYVARNAGAFDTISGDNIYIQDAQLEIGLAASPYIPTTTTTAQAGVLENTPRLNYTTGVANPYLLLEPSRTNLVTQSEYLESFPTKSSISVISNAAISPDALQNASKLIPNTSNTPDHFIRTDISVVNGSEYVMSFFAKKGEYNYVNTYTSAYSTGVIATWDLNAGVVALGSPNADIEDYGNGWYRCIWKGTTNTTSLSYRIYVSEFENRNTSFAGDGVKGAYVYGAQIEQGSYPTSYIPTYSVSATRAKDVCIKTDATGEINSTEGVLFIEGKVEEEDSFAVSTLSISDGTDSNRLSILQYRSSPLIRASMNVGGVTQFDIQIGAQTRGLYYKIAAVYSENNCSLFINGVKIGNDTSATMPSPNTFNKIGFVIAADQYNYQGNVKQVLLYPTALTDAEVITLTTP